MKVELEKVLPRDIENRSFEIIKSELPYDIDAEKAPIIIRCIHTSADFDYLESLYFSESAITKAKEALKNGCTIVTDTNMGLAGINKRALAKLGAHATCFMADPEVAEIAKANGTTRATASIDKAANINEPLIFAIGNAPTALIRIYELLCEGKLSPELVIGVPVGFVNVVQSKELIIKSGVNAIVARGRKGGSNIAAAIINALMYDIPGIRE